MKIKKLIRDFALLLFVVVFSIFLFSENAQAADWSQVGSPGFTASGETVEFTSIAFHPSTGEPYVAYRDSTNSYKANVMRYHNSAWEQVGDADFSYGSAAFVDLTFSAATEEPYITYADGGIDYSQRTSVKKFDGSSWVNVGDPQFSTGIASYNVISINPSDNVPYVAYSDFTGSARITVKKFNGATWTDVGVPNFSTGNASYVSLSFDPAINEPAVAYYDSTTGKAEVKFFTGGPFGFWTDYGIGSPDVSAGQASYTTLAYDSENHPCIAYQDGTNGSKLAVKEFIEDNWYKAIPDAPPGLSEGEADDIALASQSGTLYVAYKDEANSDKLTAKMIESSQITAIGTGVSAGQADDIDIAVNPISGEPFISYVDATNSSRVSVIKYDSDTVATSIYRFWSNAKQGHFYTASEAEKDSIIANDPSWNYEGIAYDAFDENTYGITPIYRFWSNSKQHHFFTASEAEKDSIIANDHSWAYEGIAYYAYATEQSNTTAVFRFWSQQKQGHFFTISAAERDSIIANDPSWNYEGIAWYVPE